VVATLDQLDEDAVEGLGMSEGHPGTARTWPGLGVDHTDTGIGHALEGGLDVLHRQGDVVDTRALAVQELGDGAVLGRWFQQLYVGLTHRQHGHPDLLGGHLLFVVHRDAQALDVGGHRALQVVDGDADMVDPPHGNSIALGVIEGFRGTREANAREKDIWQAPVPLFMSSRAGTLIVLLLLLQAIPLALMASAPVVEAEGDITIGPDEHLVWENGTRNLTGGIDIFGRLTVRNYELRFNLSVDGEANFRVREGGLLEFENASLLHDNLSRYLFFKVEGTFIAHDSEIEWLTGQFVTGGGIKVVGGTVEMYNTYLHDCEVQGVYVEGNGASVLLDNCRLEFMQYGVHVNDKAKATLRNGCTIEQFTRAGVLVNFGEADISEAKLVSDKTGGSQGIAARSSEITVSSTEINNVHTEGIELTDDATGTISDCYIWNCTVGIRISASSAEVEDCTIQNCLDGFNLFQSAPNISRTIMSDNFNGVSSKDCAPGYSVKDCTIGRNSQYGIYAIGKGLSESGTTWSFESEDNGIARVIQWWMLDVNVTDKDAIPISSAKVIVRASNGTKMANKTTDALGTVRDIELEGYRIENSGTITTSDKYLVRIEKGKRWAEKGVTMDMNKVLIVVLGEEPDITDNAWFWAIPIIVVTLIVIVVGYWWFRVR